MAKKRRRQRDWTELDWRLYRWLKGKTPKGKRRNDIPRISDTSDTSFIDFFQFSQKDEYTVSNEHGEAEHRKGIFPINPKNSINDISIAGAAKKHFGEDTNYWHVQINPNGWYRRYDKDDNEKKVEVSAWTVNKQKYLTPLAKSHLQDHLNKAETYYYSSNFYSPIQLLMIDIDAKNGETDAEDVAKFITDTYFPGAYYDTSTNGQGRHIYILVDCRWPNMSRTEVNKRILDFKNALQRIVVNKGYHAKMDCVNGKSCIRKKEVLTINNQPVTVSLIHTSGTNAKLPRPTMDTIGWLEASPIFTREHLQKAMADAIGLELGLASPEDVKESEEKPTRKAKSKKSSKTENLQSESCQWQKTLQVAYKLCTELGHPPTGDEVYTRFNELGLGTGQEEPDRLARCHRAAKYAELTFDNSKARIYDYAPGKYLELIISLISEDDIIKACKGTECEKRRLTHEDLDVVLGCHVTESLEPKPSDKQFTVSIDGIIGRFRALKEIGLFPKSANYNKVKISRNILIKAGLIILLDDSYKFNKGKGHGTAQKWGLGVNCPEYESIKDKQIEYLINNPRRVYSRFDIQEKNECQTDNVYEKYLSWIPGISIYK